MYFAPYIDASGVHIPTYEDRLQSLLSSYRAVFGADANLEISSPDYQLLSVFARALDDLSQIVLTDFASRNPQYASGTGLDLLLPLHGLVRGGATYSTVPLTLTGTPGAVLPSAPQALDDAGNLWSCRTAGIQLNDAGEALVLAVCSVPGAVSAPAGSVRHLVSPVAGLSSVVNAEPATPGTDAESDASCRNRLRHAASAPSVGPLGAIRDAVLSVPNVTACAVHENDTGETDERGIPAHSIAVVFSGGSLNAVAQAVFSKKAPGIGTYGNLSGRAKDAWGNQHTVRLLRAAGTNVAVTVTLQPLAGYEATVPDQIRAALTAYGETLQIGQDLVVPALYSVCFGAVSAPVPAFSVSLLSVTAGGSSTQGVLSAAWNERFVIRSNMIQIVVEE